jgi:hypothetical protein
LYFSGRRQVFRTGADITLTADLILRMTSKKV